MHGVERLPSKVGHCVIPKDTTGALMLREFFFEVKERQHEMLCAYKNMHLECICLQILDYFISYGDMVQ